MNKSLQSLLDAEYILSFNLVYTRNWSGNGGAVYSAGALDVISTSFEGNMADNEGMAMFVARIFASSRVDYVNVSFADNAFLCPRGEYGFDAVNTVSICEEL